MTDPYLDHTRCVARLIAEYEKHGRLLVALDYDNTVAPWPVDDGGTYELLLDLARECSDLGFLITIYTASNPERYPAMRAHLESRGIKVASVNANPIELPFGLWGKIYYNVLLDDRAGLASAYVALKAVVDHVKHKRLDSGA